MTSNPSSSLLVSESNLHHSPYYASAATSASSLCFSRFRLFFGVRIRWRGHFDRLTPGICQNGLNQTWLKLNGEMPNDRLCEVQSSVNRWESSPLRFRSKPASRYLSGAYRSDKQAFAPSTRRFTCTSPPASVRMSFTCLLTPPGSRA